MDETSHPSRASVVQDVNDARGTVQDRIRAEAVLPLQPKTGAAARARLRLLQRAWWGRDGAVFARGAAMAGVCDRSVSRVWRELVVGYETVKPASDGWLDWGGVLTAASK
jgi:hypothetical protein